MRYIFTLCLFWILGTTSAYADDPFTVVGVRVDAQAATVTEAQKAALIKGQVQAAEILIERITDPSARQASSYQGLDADTAGPLIRGLEVNNERRSATRYLGDVSIAFNPSAVKQLLDGYGLTMMTSQSRERLVLPVLRGEPLLNGNGWERTWQTNRFANALTPVRGLSQSQAAGLLLDAQTAEAATLEGLADLGARTGADHILVATAQQTSGGVFVRLTDVQLDTQQRTELGSVSGRTAEDAANKVVALLETNWKRAQMSASNDIVQMPVSVLYRTQADWLALQDVINTASQIKDARLDAVSKDGAVMTLSYAGDVEMLRNELAFKGVKLETGTDMGAVLTRTGRY